MIRIYHVSNRIYELRRVKFFKILLQGKSMSLPLLMAIQLVLHLHTHLTTRPLLLPIKIGTRCCHLHFHNSLQSWTSPLRSTKVTLVTRGELLGANEGSCEGTSEGC